MKFIAYLIAATLFSAAHATTVIQVDGAEADQITKDLGLTSNIPVNVHLVGFLTERAHPPVEYYDLTVSYRNQQTKPNISTEEKTALGQLFQAKGFDPAVNAGGTTYLIYDLIVECAASSCTISDGQLPGTAIP